MSLPEVFASSDELAQALADATEKAASEAIAERGRFSFALTGGSAASTLYPKLASLSLPWKAVHVWFGDERSVPIDDAESNFKLARDAFLSHVPIAEENVHRMRGEIDPAQAASEYEKDLLSVDPAIDVIHLGMGPDGHVCSLFPGHPLLREKERLVASLTDSPKPPPSRITLTLPALQRARAVWFLVMGEGKAEAVRAALLDSHAESTAAIVHRTCRSRWLIDKAAASRL